MTITKRHIEMISPKGFDQLFEQEAGKTTYREAFEKLNNEYKEAFGKKRYKDYQSYRQSRRQRIKFSHN